MPDIASYDAIDPHFVRDLTRSHAHVLTVADWLRRLGKTVEVAPLRVRPDLHHVREFSDAGDLRVNGKRVEVKQRMLNFTDRATFPYPTIIVDVATSWDRADPKPWGYILTNKAVMAAGVVRASTADRWHRVERLDQARGRSRLFLECPVNFVEFCRIDPPPPAAPESP